MNCAKCDSKNVTSRKNYTHGKSSKAKVGYLCKECGSTEIKTAPVFGRKRR